MTAPVSPDVPPFTYPGLGDLLDYYDVQRLPVGSHVFVTGGSRRVFRKDATQRVYVYATRTGEIQNFPEGATTTLMRTISFHLVTDLDTFVMAHQLGLELPV